MGLKFRKVPTGSGATGVQLVEWVSGRLVVRGHLGSAHTPGELAALIEVAKQRIQGDQQALAWVFHGDLRIAGRK